MNESFSDMLAVGKVNSLGRVHEVVAAALHDSSRLEELYRCLFEDDAWLRMRAADSLGKVCREHPEWVEPYIDRFQADLADSTQASIQWHLALMYQQVKMTQAQQGRAITWLKQLLTTTEVDWIAAANAMDALVYFERQGVVPKSDVRRLLNMQRDHKSKSVVRRASKLLENLGETYS